MERETVLRVEGLCRRYGRVRALNHVSFEVYKGEFFSLLGPSGCGKSTTLRIIAGLERPDSGEVALGGRTVVSGKNGIFVPAEKRNLGLVFQSYAVWPHMTVAGNVSYPLEVRRWDKREIGIRSRRVLEQVGLGGLENRPASQLSGGQQQRLALARSLVYEPDLLLLDEPLSNVDAKLREQLRIELKKLQQSLDVTIIYVTHDQTEALSMSHRIAVMNEGSIEQIGRPKETYADPATFFVQTFVGHLVAFWGRVVERQSVKRIELPGSVYLDFPGGTTLPVDHRVCVAARPEDIRVLPNNQDSGRHRLPATVHDASDLGSHVEYTLSAAGTEFVLETSSGLKLEAGQEIVLGVESMRIWPV